MCHFCGNVGHLPARLDLRPMSELHLTEVEYAEYKSHSASDTLYKKLADNDCPKLRVVGFNDDTKAVFSTCNPDGHDYIEVPWSTMDSVKWIAQRVEDEIRVALHHWYLATADGVIFKTFGELVCTTAAFRVKGQVADKSVKDDLKEFEGEDRPAVYEKIEKAIDNVVSSTEILSQIYSPTNPTAIKISLEYHYRTRYSSVEFYCNIYYRAHPSITDSKLVLSTPQGPHKMNGFRLLLEMGLADMPPGRRWRAIEERTFDLSQAQARTLYRILFGKAADSDAEPASLGEKIDVREMIELLLASVGISFYVVLDPDDEEDGIEGSERWMGRHIRSIAGCALMPRDDEESDKAEETDDEDNEDEDEDGWSDEDESFGRGAVLEISNPAQARGKAEVAD
ncbi:hypothetical protein C8R44DRAFT_746698 [Mycena epipterygia]|nr:hypothetical protein C8R44DRAFT_746698 [Mycena epipterygia]